MPKVTFPHGFVDVGKYLVANVTAGALYFVGSKWPPPHAVKSPANIAAVGTNAVDP
jgi:hypothetical protein